MLPPRTWADLTPGWLTAALQRDFPGVVVDGVRRERVADGTNARATLRLTYASGTGPERVFVKREGAWLNRLALTALGAREAEAELARRGVVLPLEHPRLYAGATDARRLATVVVMEDVTLRGATPYDPRTPLTPEQVRSGLEGLAALHREHWGRPRARPWRLGAAWAPVVRAGFAHAHLKLRRMGRADLVADTPTAIDRGFRSWSRLARQGPQTLLHGDPHPGNAYGLPDGTTGFYDWQLVRSGTWAHDVGYLIVSALTPADRRAHERDLLEGYRRALGHQVDLDLDLYRRTPAFGLGSWLQTLAAGTFQPVEICLPVIERFAAAYVDHR